MRFSGRSGIRLMLVLAAALLLVSSGSALASRQHTDAVSRKPSGRLEAAFAHASREFGVPESVLKSVAYNESRWDEHLGEVNTSGGYGVMNLTDVRTTSQAGNKGTRGPRSGVPSSPGLHTLGTASKLLGVGPGVLKRDPAQNVRGGAALLALYARQTTGHLPKDPAEWYGAVAKYSGSTLAGPAELFANDVYATIRHGASRTNEEGQRVTLRPQEGLQPDRATAKPLGLATPASGPKTDCPAGLDCRFIPAAYKQNSPNDPSDYGNYDLADRERDGLDIRYIVIHDTEETYAKTIQIFRDPMSYVSAHYVLSSRNGQVTEMVRPRNIAWQAGNWDINAHSIGVEHEGFAIDGASWYTEQMYRASARLVRYLAARYNVPLDREHIIGHDNVPGPLPAYVAGMHWDPGPFWDWGHYMQLIGAKAPRKGNSARSAVVVIDPYFATNRQRVKDCGGSGKLLAPQPASFVYLHTAPSNRAPLVSDPALHPNGSPGTRCADDWGDKASWGQVFYRAGNQGDWEAIYYGGRKVWFYNPQDINADPASGTLVTPKAGKHSIPVYGQAYPEGSAYPKSVPKQDIVPLQYRIPSGQVYVADGLVRGQYYYAPTYTRTPATHTLVTGKTAYYEISFNHRVAFVKKSDVQVISHR
ncbi:N-acetylmuramoyl-L-alanine amidase [Rubrobacter calidifluminis]|uniref:N-acetylmuramoyl-L-alanine amidase n=1 Tax=Rubrobacter calidifluminis TaxID=1392640 RepID=UPI00235E7481|nr:N-acetylmuramoyl-L-alanine amidase [Rubrobacter calidifluminis]